MRNRNSLTPGIDNKLRTRIIWGAGTTAVVIAAVVLMDFLNGLNMSIKSNQVSAFELNFINSSSGEIQNEGQVYFHGDLTNEGIMNCGDCSMGTTYFTNDADSQQVISGSNNISFYNLVVDNEEGVKLETEVQIFNSLLFEEGVVSADKSTSNSFIHFKEGAIHDQAGEGKHVNGYVKKTGAETFTFPIGDGTRFMGSTIYPRKASDVFQAAYFHVDPNDAIAPSGGPFPTNVFDVSHIYQVNTNEYWDIDGSVSTPITLTWDESSEIEKLVDNVAQIGVVGWDGTQWTYLNQANVTGDLVKGSVTSFALIPDNFVAFTLAKISTTLLPVEWLSFNVELKESDAHLDWVTASEKNADAYEIERSSTGQEFTSVGFTPAMGIDTDEISEYDYVDPGVTYLGESRLYYRLRQIDIDGAFQYSRIIELNIQQATAKPELTIYPNPTEEFVNVLLKDPSQNGYLIRIFNMHGQLIHEGSAKANISTQISLGSWAEGTYSVVLTDGKSQYTKKLVIAK